MRDIRANLPKDPPHRAIGKAATDIISSVESVGHGVMNALDAPLDSVGAPEGPHRVVDNVADLAASTVKNTIRKVTGA